MTTFSCGEKYSLYCENLSVHPQTKSSIIADEGANGECKVVPSAIQTQQRSAEAACDEFLLSKAQEGMRDEENTSEGRHRGQAREHLKMNKYLYSIHSFWGSSQSSTPSPSHLQDKSHITEARNESLPSPQHLTKCYTMSAGKLEITTLLGPRLSSIQKPWSLSGTSCQAV
jgi:hypothetical protein